jgi:Holliday junction resolvasome RuvABC endonuclease subunit
MTQGNLKSDLVLGLDISSSRTGWALVRSTGEIEGYGIITPFKAIKDKDPNFGVVLLAYASEIKRVLKGMETHYSQEIDYAVMEDLNIRFNSSNKILTNFQAAAKLACAIYNKSMPVYLVNNKTVKAFYKVNTFKAKFTEDTLLKAKRYQQKPVKILMVGAVNKIHKLELTYAQNDEADAIATAVTYIHKNKKGK